MRLKYDVQKSFSNRINEHKFISDKMETENELLASYMIVGRLSVLSS